MIRRHQAGVIALGISLVGAGFASMPPRSPAPLAGASDVDAPSASPADTVVSSSPEPELVDLLRIDGAVVAVSSEVHDGVHEPSHLVDGRAETAWQGRRGDLVGAWIAFRVAWRSRVRRIGLVAGCGGASKRGDPFRLNQRIARVVVRRAGEVVGEWALDPDDRTMQYFELDAEGGAFRLEVSEVVPGDNPAWKEICVSELAVDGTPPEDDAAPTRDPPRVLVGGLDIDRGLDELAIGPFRSPEALCADEVPWCWNGDDTSSFAAAAPFVELHPMITDRFIDDGTYRILGTAVRTSFGWYRLPIALDREAEGDGSSGTDAEVVAAQVLAGGILSIRARTTHWTHEAYDRYGIATDPGLAHYRDFTLLCRAQGRDVRCRTCTVATAPDQLGGEPKDATWTRPELPVVDGDGVIHCGIGRRDGVAL